MSKVKDSAAVVDELPEEVKPEDVVGEGLPDMAEQDHPPSEPDPDQIVVDQKVQDGFKGDSIDWATDADWAIVQQEPLRAKWMLRVAFLVLIALLVWANYAEVDEVTRGEGRVIPSSQLQIVQSVDGGVVEEILVSDGQAVRKGQILLKIDPTRFVSNLRENRVQFLALRVKAERLRALAESRDFEPSAELVKEIPDIVNEERTLFHSSQREVDAQIRIAKDQSLQRRQELKQVRAKLEQASRAYEFASQELALTRPLITSGAVSEVDILRLEREIARLKGERAQAAAQIPRIQSAIHESESKIQEVRLNFENRMRNDLSETMAKISSLSESSTALADRVQKAEVRSPVNGTVKRLLVNTVGGVVQPGTELVEIVPVDDALLLEAKVSPKDIAFLRPAQPATVKFTAYDFAIYGGLDAVVENIGADTVIDEQGVAYYIIRVRTLETSLGEDLPIIPGMVAQVDVLTGKKTILSYLLKPVLRAKANALSER